MNFKNSRRRSARPQSLWGFTLIELMITVAIIAILAAIALPSYESYVRKGRRADAQSFMQEVVARQQHFLLDRRAYGDGITTATAAGGLGMTVPANVSSFYTLAMVTNNAVSPPVFTITAAPAGRQISEPCGTLSIDQRGAKTASGTGTCW